MQIFYVNSIGEEDFVGDGHSVEDSVDTLLNYGVDRGFVIRKLKYSKRNGVLRAYINDSERHFQLRGL